MHPRLALALLLAALLAGCDTAGYLGQAAWGQARLVAARRPLTEVIADPFTPAALAAQLRLIDSLRGFATAELGMREVRGFDTFVVTGRSHAVWNVVAVPEFSVVPLSWCFPVAGCVSYRGYFAHADAKRFASALHTRGYDATLYGVAAYSTLGWFADPVLDTWAMRREHSLAALVFHELAHQLVYAADDTAFSEAFARVVEREGVRRWLQVGGRSDDYTAYLREQAADREFAELLGRTRERLRALYAEPLQAAMMRERKQHLLEELRAEYAVVREQWPADYRFDGWMSVPLDNARLASVANYEQRVPALQALLEASGGSLEAFYAAARELAELSADERAVRLDAQTPRSVLKSACQLQRGSLPMRRSTCDLCDDHPDAVQVAEPLFRDFGARSAFSGRIVTIKCHEDNSRVRDLVAEDGRGCVLVVDGGGSLRRSLLGDQLAAKAVASGWEGMLIFGAVRDVEALAGMDLGIRALGAIPLKTDRKGVGERDLALRFAGVDFVPGHHLYADGNGIVVAASDLEAGG